MVAPLRDPRRDLFFLCGAVLFVAALAVGGWFGGLVAVLSAVVVLVLGTVYRRSPSAVLIALVAIPTFESIAIMAVGYFIPLPGPLVKALLSLKFALLGSAALSGVLLRDRRAFMSADLFGYLVIAWTGLVLLATFDATAPGVASAQLRGAFAMVTPVLLYFAGRFAPITHAQTRTVFRVTLVVAFAAACFGLFERLLLPISFWDDLRLGEFIVMKGGLGFTAVNGIDAILGSYFSRRLIGPFAYPLNAGYFLVLPSLLCIAALLERRLRPTRGLAIATVVFVAAEALTFTRGAWLGIVAGVLYLTIYSRRARWLIPALVVALVLFTLTPMGERLILPTLTMSDPSARFHFMVLVRDLSIAFGTLFGYGFGTAGFSANLAVGRATVGENLFATTAMQAGLIGLAIFIAFIIGVLRALLRSRKGVRLDVLRHALLASTIAFALGSLTTEHWQAFESAGLYWLWCGMFVKMTSEETAGDER